MVEKLSISRVIGLSIVVIGIVAGLILSKTEQNINKSAASDTSISIVPASQEVNLNKSFTAQVQMNSGENRVTGIDLEMTFDSDQIHIDGIEPTTELTNFNTILKNEVNNSTGVMRYAAFTLDKNLAISGNLTLLTIYGNIPAGSRQDTYQINFTESSSVIAVDEGQNVIISKTGGTIKIIGGEPNFCGGTCGSNNNCQPNYFCYQGFCRNPVCASDTTCNCTITATPTARPATTRPTTRSVTNITTSRPSPTPSPTMVTKGGVETLPPSLDYAPVYPDIEREPDTSITTEDLKNQVLPNFIKYLIGALLVAIALALGIAIWIKKNRIHHILPPTNI